MKQRIYIAGKITGVPFEEAESNFLFAAGVIEKAGHEALNPMELVDQTEGRTYNEYLADALCVMLKQADAVYFLSNWNQSKGAKIEHATATALGMPMYHGLDEMPVVAILDGSMSHPIIKSSVQR